MRMIFAILLLVGSIYPLRLPEATMGKPYTASMGQQLSGCKIDKEAKTNPAMARGLPPGLTLAENGSISGTPTMPAFWMFVAACGQDRVIATIPVRAK